MDFVFFLFIKHYLITLFLQQLSTLRLNRSIYCVKIVI